MARENGAAIAALAADGIAVFPADDEYAPTLAASCAGSAPPADLRLARARPTSRWPRAEWQRRRAGTVDDARRPPARRRFALRVAGRAQRAQRARRDRLRARRRRRRSTRSCAAWRRFAPVKRPLAGQALRARRRRDHADRRHLQRQSRLGARRDRRAGRRCRRRAGWCSATWARSATRGRRSIARSARTRASAASTTLWARGDAERDTRRGVRRRACISPSVDALARRARRRAGEPASACWSRARAS